MVRATFLAVLAVFGVAATASAQTPTKPRRASPVLMPRGTQPSAPAPAPAPATPSAQPTTPSRGVTPQGAASGGAAAGSFGAGLAIEPFAGEEDARPAYLRRFVTQLDSAVVLLVGVFRGTSGAPMANANGPTDLSQRERDRWTRCRDLHWDLQSYAAAMHDLTEYDAATVTRAAAALDTALTALEATSECDAIASMITAPERFTPWAGNYTTSARQFYQSWYAQLRNVADRNRAFVIALNPTLEAAQRIPVPPAMSRMAPTAGATPR